MAEPLNVLTHSFNNGEASKAALNRVDKEALRLYADYQENLAPYVIGKAMMRPGTQYLVGTADNGRPELLPFESSDDDVPDAILVATGGKLRVMVGDAYITRPAVTSTVTNGDFNSSTGWTLTVSDGAAGDINSTVASQLYMQAAARGSSVICTRSVSTSSAGTLHALRIVVVRGPVKFRCGETAGGEDYVEEVMLDAGEHSLAFTPTGTYHVWFKTTDTQNSILVGSIQVEAAGILSFDAPWLTDDLRKLRTAQSEDVMFIASPYQPRRVERRGDGENSWSFVLYQPTGGPFMTARSSSVRLQPGNNYGTITLNADADFFVPSHVGTLFRLDHDKFFANFALAGDGQYTDTWRISGIKTDTENDRRFSYTTTGTWSGTITMERSQESEFDGFNEARYDDSVADVDFTTNQSITHDSNTDEANIIYWYRMGFQEGEYTSGSINIAVSVEGWFGYGICRIVHYVSPTQVLAEVMRDFRALSPTQNWREGEWSDRRGWPTAVEFHDGRLFWSRAGKYWGSESDNYTSFDAEVEGDSRTIGRTITIGASATVRWMLSLQRLIFGSRNGEISARSDSFDAPLTATNITLRACSTQGSADVMPVRIDSRGVFVQRSGRKVYELAYDVETNDYVSNSMMRINEDLALSDWIDTGASYGSIVRIAAQRQPDTHIWCVREDGVCVVLLYEPGEKVRGWWRVITGNVAPGSDAPWDRVITVAVLPGDGEDQVYLGIERDIDGVATYYIEKLRFHAETVQCSYDADAAEVQVRNGLYLADSFIISTGSSVAAQTFSGYSHLSSRDVIAIGQVVGGNYGPLLDATGEVLLLTVNVLGEVSLPPGVAMSGDVCIGLPYRGRYRSSKLAYGTDGTALLQNKIVQELGIALLDTHPDAIRVGRNFVTAEMDELPRIKGDGSEREADPDGVLERAVDEQTFSFPGAWDTDSRVCIEVRPGFSATLSAIVMGIEANDG